MGMTRLKRWMLGAGLLGCSALAMAQQAEVPEGYRIAQQVLVGDGSVLEVLEDLRITPELHANSWGNGLDADSLLPSDDDHPVAPLGALARLVSDGGEVLAQKSLDYPMATVEKAPLNGLPSPAFFLTIDQTAPMGSYSGPLTEVLTPEQSQLDPVLCLGEGGEKQPLVFAQTGKAAWQAMQTGYEAQRREGRLPATFEVVYGHAWKAAPRKTADGRAVIRFDRPGRK